MVYQATRRKYFPKYSGLCITCKNLFYSANCAAAACSCSCVRGSLRPSWKGGRSKNVHGYVRLLSHGHPRADRWGYVFEHILVMENHLGRFLSTKETIHHRNGIRDDNRLDNLELRTGQHGKGQTPDDLVQFTVDNYPEKVVALLKARASLSTNSE